MNAWEEKKQLLYAIYEGGLPFDEAMIKLCNAKSSKYTRIQARELIERFMNANQLDVPDHQHYLLILPNNLVQKLSDMLQTEVTGGRVHIDDNAPSVW